MASSNYMLGRKQYVRPQGVLFSKNPGYPGSYGWIPDGYEFGAYNISDSEAEFIILSDDNRSPIEVKPTRIENRKRMINGRMRSYHIADKLTINLSWTMLPSRSHFGRPDFDINTGQSPIAESCTSDGGAGGVELLRWYENNQGPFWVFLAYDKYTNFVDSQNQTRYDHLREYNQVVEMYISNFEYSIQKRGGTTDDMWNISMSLEEV